MKKLFTIITLLLSIAVSVSAGPKDPDDLRRVQFDHKSMNIHKDVSFKKLESMEKLMPRSMREEIANDYYPYLRKNLVDKDYLEYKKAKITVQRHNDNLITLSMEFPHYFLTFKNITWKDLDTLYHVHFEE